MDPVRAVCIICETLACTTPSCRPLSRYDRTRSPIHVSSTGNTWVYVSFMVTFIVLIEALQITMVLNMTKHLISKGIWSIAMFVVWGLLKYWLTTEWLAHWTTDTLIYWFADLLSYWLTELLTKWLTHWNTEWPTVSGILPHWATNLLSYWLTDWMTHWATELLRHWLTDLLNHCATDSLTDWLTEILTLTRLLTHWLTERLTQWLTDLQS